MSDLDNTTIMQDDSFQDFGAIKLNRLQTKLVDSLHYYDTYFSNLSSTGDLADVSVLFDGKQKTTGTSKPKVDSQTLGCSLKQLVYDGKYLIVSASKEKTDKTSTLSRISGINKEFVSEYGLNCLRIGWPYVAGFLDKTQLEADANNPKKGDVSVFDQGMYFAPLLLWNLTLNCGKNGDWVLNVAFRNDKPIVQVNSCLLLSSLHVKHISFTQISDLVDVEFNSDSLAFAINIAEKYKKYGIELSSDQISQLANMLTAEKLDVAPTIAPTMTQEEVVKTLGTFDIDKVNLYNCAMFGLYRDSSISLYSDYNEMRESNGSNFIETIDDRIYDKLQLSKDFYRYFDESNLREIVKLDIFQKSACNVALNDSLVISGAAGTGKSQTLSSIIANGINNSESVLFCAEKKEALNVVYNRLGRLRNYCLKFYPSSNIRKEFTRQLKNGLSRVSLLYGLFDQISQLDRNVESNNLDEIFLKVDKFKKIMSSKDGRKYPSFIRQYNEKKDMILQVSQLVGPIVRKSNTSGEFWNTINKMCDDYHDYEHLHELQKSLGLEDEIMLGIFDLMKVFDNSPTFYENYLKQYVVNGNIDEKLEKLPNSIINKSEKDPRYKKYMEVFPKIDIYSFDIIRVHDRQWYKMMIVQSEQKSLKNVLEFTSKYNPENFDYALMKKYRTMMRFAAQYSQEFQVDNENYYDDINYAINSKLSQDMRETELEFGFKVIGAIFENEVLYNQFNKLYSYIAWIDEVDSIEQTLALYTDVISLIFPVVMSSPDMASLLLRCTPGLFSIGIIDEASMLPLEFCMPLLYRCQRWVIAGDVKQLPPPSYLRGYRKHQQLVEQLSKSYSKSDDQHLKIKIIEGASSLLEYARTKLQTIVLSCHYRSVKKELFEFSNIVFYKSGVLAADDQNTSTIGKTGIQFINAKGHEQDGINIDEAQQVVKIVEQIVADPDHGSIGIICTTEAQREYIEMLLRTHSSKTVSNEFTRFTKDGQDISMFVLSCAKIQGSERDNIIISFAASKKQNDVDGDTILNTMSTLISPIGKNYLNVMITRAKSSLYIVNSFEPEDINLANHDTESVRILRDFFLYCRALNASCHDLNDSLVQEVFKPYQKDDMAYDFSNDLYDRSLSWVADDLRARLIAELKNVGRIDVQRGQVHGGVDIGIVIYDKVLKRNVLGVLCDEFMYDITISGKQRDYYNRKFLESRNWNFYQVSALQWSKVYKQEQIIKAIINRLFILIADYEKDVITAEYKDKLRTNAAKTHVRYTDQQIIDMTNQYLEEYGNIYERLVSQQKGEKAKVKTVVKTTKTGTRAKKGTRVSSKKG